MQIRIQVQSESESESESETEITRDRGQAEAKSRIVEESKVKSEVFLLSGGARAAFFAVAKIPEDIETRRWPRVAGRRRSFHPRS